MTARRPAHVLMNPLYRRLWLATSVCSLGDWLTLLALTALAGNIMAPDGFRAQALAVGGVFAAKLVPVLLLRPVMGAIANRVDRGKAMVCADLSRVVLGLLVVVMLWMRPSVAYYWILAVTLLFECANLLSAAARDATVPSLVPKERLGQANQLNLMVGYGTAPLAAGLFALLSLGDLLSSGSWLVSSTLTLLVGTVTFLFSALLVLGLHDIPGADETVSADRAFTGPAVGKVSTDAVSTGPAADAVSADSASGDPGSADPASVGGRSGGWRAVRGHRLVRGLIFGMLGITAAGGAVLGVAKPYATALGGGDAAYGMIFGALFAGMVLGVYFGPRFLRELPRRRLFGLLIISAGLLLIAIAVIHNLVIVVMLTAALGACAGTAWSVGYSLVGLEVEDSTLGRTFFFLQSAARVTLLLVAAVAGPLAALSGSYAIGADALSYDFDGANLVLVVGGVVAIVMGIVGLRRMDDRRGVPLAADLIAAVRGTTYSVDRPQEETPGLFLAFEGGEGSGKTTQSRMVAIWLRDQGYDVVQTREPGATKIGMRLRAILLDASAKGLSERAEALLYAADRAEHVEKVILPALHRGAVVVTDRYVDSSLAYQGAGRALDSTDVSRVNTWATDGLMPHLTVLIDTPPEVGLERLGGAADRIESEPVEFHEKVRRGFRALAAADPERYLVVDGTLPPEEITQTVQDRIREILPDPVPQESEDATGTMPAIRD